MVKSSFEEKQIKQILSGIYQPKEEKIPFYPDVFRKKVIVIAGPTAVGKTRLSLMLAEKLGGEIISADSVQVYRGMDIGTAKASLEERARVPHHLIDIRDIQEKFTVVDFFHEARLSCEGVAARNRAPIVVGGTGFYIHALLYGAPKGPPASEEVRMALEADIERLGIESLYERLQELDPDYAKTITMRDKSKIIRALEVIALTGDQLSKLSWKTNRLPIDYDFRCWFIYRPKDILYPLIEARCEEMLNMGLLQEVQELVKCGLNQNNSAKNAIGYRQVLNYLNSNQTEDDYHKMIDEFKKASRRYAKRQFTWFRKEPLFKWLNLDVHDLEIAVDIIAQDYQEDATT